jgi:carbonic anhydrase
MGPERHLGTTFLDSDQRAHVMDLVDNGHTIQVTNDAPLSMKLGQTAYELVQYHFHAPSEHTIDGEHAPLEAHFVNRSTNGELAVFSVLFEEGEHNADLGPVFSALPNGPDDPRHLEGLDIDVIELRPRPDSFYRYQGSLTTPPCSEQVQWIVVADKYQISAEQMAGIVSHLHHNNRPVQSLGDRVIGLITRD